MRDRQETKSRQKADRRLETRYVGQETGNMRNKGEVRRTGDKRQTGNMRKET